jgi:hypothetical protein
MQNEQSGKKQELRDQAVFYMALANPGATREEVES